MRSPPWSPLKAWAYLDPAASCDMQSPQTPLWETAQTHPCLNPLQQEQFLDSGNQNSAAWRTMLRGIPGIEMDWSWCRPFVKEASMASSIDFITFICSVNESSKFSWDAAVEGTNEVALALSLPVVMMRGSCVGLLCQGICNDCPKRNQDAGNWELEIKFVFRSWERVWSENTSWHDFYLNCRRKSFYTSSLDPKIIKRASRQHSRYIVFLCSYHNRSM